MSTSKTSFNDLELGKRIDRICDRFEAAWSSEKPLRIEELLETIEETHRENLFRELLELELDLRELKPENETAYSEYKERFPDRIAVIDLVFGKHLVLKQLGDYELLDQIGHGGMGVVYKARQRFLNQLVAIKILPRQFLKEPQALARFLREMQMIGGLSHPNIVRAYNAGEANGLHYLVMEFVDGVNINQLIKRNEQGKDVAVAFPIPAACEVIRQAALGLQNAFENGLVHRDIKPANIMIDRSGTVKILDLGLGKFQADQRPQGDPSLSLTQIGTTMGTIDYMAPEQWDDAGKVDIRADIYGLGCTFFYLLSGRPPFADDRYDSARKKFMGHMLAPVPVLSEEIPACPAKLDKILEKMMAKEPSERYSEPIEIADALEQFADEEKFFAFFDDALETLERYGVVPESSESPNARRNTSRHSRKRPKTFWDFFEFDNPEFLLKKVLPVCIALILIIAIAGYGISRLRSQNESDASVQVLSQERVETIRNDLVQLPGLNGQWWFVEMPWYLPFARESLAENLIQNRNPGQFLGEKPGTYLEPNMQEVHSWLQERLKNCEKDFSPGRRKLYEGFREFAAAPCDREESIKRLQSLYGEFETASLKSSKEPAADIHTRAVVLHRLSGLNNDPKMQEKSLRLYSEAIKAYSGKTDSTSRLLLSLCKLDYTRLKFRNDQNYDNFHTEIERILSEKGNSDLFRIELRIDLAATASGAAKYRNDIFLEAERELKSSEIGNRSHPLTAHLQERFAWSLIDQWMVLEANGRFKLALQIRETNLRETEDELARIYVFHNKHGIAMTNRYLGNLELAKQGYGELVPEIKKSMDAVGSLAPFPGQQQYYANLRERLSNSRERWADCMLYGGTASSSAPVELENAVRLCIDSRNDIEDEGVKEVMSCKAAILNVFLGKPLEAENLLKPLLDERKNLLGNQKRALMMRELALAVVKLESPETAEEGASCLRNFLIRFRLYPNDPESLRRETLEIRLLAAELLLWNSLKNNDPRSSLRDLGHLESILTQMNASSELTPYLRRYLELAMRSVRAAYDPERDNERVLLRLAAYIRRMCTEERDEMPFTDPPTLVMFHISNDLKQSFSILVPQDSRPGALIPLPFTREEIRSAANNGKVVPLPDSLREMIMAEKALGKRIEITWADSHAWPVGSKEALGEREWPFKNSWPK